MFKMLKLDYDLSKQMYEECKHLVEVKECYSNVAKITIHHVTYEESLSDIKIAFGAWQIPLDGGSNLYAKHCFFLLDGKVVDPTHFTTTEEKDNRDYLVIKTFDISEYIKALRECKGDSYLGKYTEKLFRQLFINMMENSMVLAG